MTLLNHHSPRTNEVWLWLSVIVCNVGNLRRLALPRRIEQELYAPEWDTAWLPGSACHFPITGLSGRVLRRTSAFRKRVI